MSNIQPLLRWNSLQCRPFKMDKIFSCRITGSNKYQVNLRLVVYFAYFPHLDKTMGNVKRYLRIKLKKTKMKTSKWVKTENQQMTGPWNWRVGENEAARRSVSLSNFILLHLFKKTFLQISKGGVFLQTSPILKIIHIWKVLRLIMVTLLHFVVRNTIN